MIRNVFAQDDKRCWFFEGCFRINIAAFVVLVLAGCSAAGIARAQIESVDMSSFDLISPKDGEVITHTRAPTLTWERSYAEDVVLEEKLADKPSGKLRWDAHYQADKQALRLTEENRYQSGALAYEMNPGPRFVVQFDLWVMKEKAPGTRNGGRSYFFVYNEETPNVPSKSTGGYTIVFDNYSNKIRLVWNGEDIASVSEDGFSDSSWHDVVILMADRQIALYLDGEEKLRYTDEERRKSGNVMGFGGRNGGSYSVQRVRNMKVTRLAPVEHYEIFVDDAKVDTVEATPDDDPFYGVDTLGPAGYEVKPASRGERSEHKVTAGATRYKIDPVSYGEHSWHVVSVTEDGDRTRSEQKRSMSIRRGVSMALAGEVQDDQPQSLQETFTTWKKNLHYPHFEFTFHVGNFVASGDSDKSPTESVIEESVAVHAGDRICFSGQTIGSHDVSDWEERADQPHKGLESVMQEIGMSSRTFAFEYDNVLFVNLGVSGGPGRMSKETVAWLFSLAARFPEKPTVIFSHAAGTNRVGEENASHAFFTKEREDVPAFWKGFLSQDQIVGWFHGIGADTADEALGKHYGVVYGNMVQAAIPTFWWADGEKKGRSAYVQITEDAIHTMIWDEKRDEMVAKQVEAGYDLDVKEEGFGAIFMPKFVQDGEKWEYTNYFGAQEVSLNLIGTAVNDLAYNNYFSKFIQNETYSLGNPGYNGEAQEKGRAEFDKGESLRLVEQDDGIGVEDPASSWIKVIPGKKYEMSMWLKGYTAEKDVMDVTIRYSEGSVSSFASEEKLFSGVDVGNEYQKYTVQFTAPSNSDLWRAQLVWRMSGENRVSMDRYEVKRVGTGKTRNFGVLFNGEEFYKEKVLGHNEMVSFDIDPALVDRFTPIGAAISGNKVGILEIEYRKPVVYSQHAAVGIEEVSDDQLKVKLSRVAEYNEETRYFPLCDIAETSVPVRDEYRRVFYEIPNTVFVFSGDGGVIEKTFTVSQ